MKIIYTFSGPVDGTWRLTDTPHAAGIDGAEVASMVGGGYCGYRDTALGLHFCVFDDLDPAIHHAFGAERRAKDRLGGGMTIRQA